MLSRFLAMLFVVVALTGTGLADSAVIDVGFDRWMYPFNASPGDRPSGSTFGAVGIPDFDDRDAQIVIGFDTAGSGIPSGIGTSNYVINSARVELTTATDEAFVLDPTYDAYTTYLELDLGGTPDEDEGRPVELYGMATRNGYVALEIGPTVAGPPIFNEADAFGLPGPPVPANGNRNALSTDDDAESGRDVSNNVRDGFDPSPWSVGDVSSLSAGQSVPVDTAMEFEIDLNNAQALDYLQEGLESGELFFGVSSMHRSVQGSSEGIPSFHLGTLNGDSLGQRAQLHLDYEIVPEPTALGLLAMGVLALGTFRRSSS